jgi:hypothetical protein
MLKHCGAFYLGLSVHRFECSRVESAFPTTNRMMHCELDSIHHDSR